MSPSSRLLSAVTCAQVPPAAHACTTPEPTPAQAQFKRALSGAVARRSEQCILQLDVTGLTGGNSGESKGVAGDLDEKRMGCH